MARLLIGSYVMDSADSGSSSTTAGVQLDLDDPEEGQDPMTPQVGSEEFRWPIMYAAVSAANEGALKTAVEALRDAIQDCAGKTITYEETSGTTLWQMHANMWPVAEGGFDVQMGDTTAYVSFALTGRRPGVPASGAADEAGILPPGIRWQHDQSAGGTTAILARATFGPTLSGTTVTAGSRANAVAWINRMKSSANWSTIAPFQSTAYKYAGALTDFDQHVNLATLTEADYHPASIELRFIKADATWNANPSLPASFVSGNMNTQVVDRQPLNSAAGQNPGTDIILHGSFVLKTEADTGFNSSDSALADANIKAAAEAVVAVAVAHFRAVMVGVDLTQFGLPVIDMDPVSGAFAYRVRFTADAAIRLWDEEVLLRSVQMRVRSRSTDGKKWIYKMKGGPERTAIHSMHVEAQTPVLYRNPILGSGWTEDESSSRHGPASATIQQVDSNGAVTYITRGEKLFTYDGASALSGILGFAITPGGDQ